MTEEMIPVNPSDILNFKCSSQNPCFNDCCRNLNQALTPYDILRLKNNLRMTSYDFLKEYTSLHYGPESGLPVVEFKPNPATGHACPFVTEKGCSVYEDRPGSCRLYPLARAVARSRQTGELTEFFALIEEPHCMGFSVKTGRTIEQWLRTQDVARHNHYNDMLMEIISLKNRIIPGKLQGADSDRFYLGLYDLDEFRKQIREKNILKNHDIVLPDDVTGKIMEDDEALLDFGIQWVKHVLFGIKIQYQGSE